jgi:hypothetical protein
MRSQRERRLVAELDLMALVGRPYRLNFRS